MEYLPLIIGYLLIVLTPAMGLWQKAMPRLERKPTDTFIPFYNYFVVLKACKLPWYWVIFLLFPGIQFIMWASINVSYIRKFGLYSVKDTILGILFPFPVFWKIANNPEKYKAIPETNWDVAKQVDQRTPSDHVALFFALPVIGHAICYPFSLLGVKRKPGKKSIFKEWGDAILFAVVAASAIRTYVFEPYKIPTGSMERTLLVGDHLFVDKLTFGARLPMTPFSYPIVHNSFAPIFNVKSYIDFQRIPYTRLPGFRFVERNDVVVFNFPAGDTAINDPRMPNGLIGHTYNQVLNDEAFFAAKWNRSEFESKKDFYLSYARDQIGNKKIVHSNIVDGFNDGNSPTGVRLVRGLELTASGDGLLPRPVDKRENYIKRCVAVSGDVIQVIEQNLFVNGKLAFKPKGLQTNGRPLPKGYYHMMADSTPFRPEFYQCSYFPIFPNDPQYDWTEDNFGPLQIPKAGDVVELNHKTLPIYRRIISAYEGHKLEEKVDGIYIDGKKVTSYTIKQNYYWLMGDNRNNSADSRFWGFVPEDHIVGHAAFIWLSTGEKGMFGGGMRWNRLFKGIE